MCGRRIQRDLSLGESRLRGERYGYYHGSLPVRRRPGLRLGNDLGGHTRSERDEQQRDHVHRQEVAQLG